MLDLLVDRAVRGRLSATQLVRIRRVATRMVRAASLRDDPAVDLEVSLRLTDDASIHALNRDYRKKNKPTDVLAFALREGPGGELAGPALGDVVVSLDTAARQARRGLPAEVEHLTAHGLCHLLGYDHRTDAEEAVMNRRARGLLAVGRGRGRISPA